MTNIQRSLRGALVAGTALLLACGDMGTDPTTQRFLGCDVQQVFLDESRNGTLSTNDCQLQGAYTDMYFLDLRNDRDLLIIDLQSFDFDGYLALYDWDTRELIADNDNLNAFTTDARLAGSLPRGRYVIAASSWFANETGRYVLTVD